MECVFQADKQPGETQRWVVKESGQSHENIGWWLRVPMQPC
jgi:hypothetical protein